MFWSDTNRYEDDEDKYNDNNENDDTMVQSKSLNQKTTIHLKYDYLSCEKCTSAEAVKFLPKIKEKLKNNRKASEAWYCSNLLTLSIFFLYWKTYTNISFNAFLRYLFIYCYELIKTPRCLVIITQYIFVICLTFICVFGKKKPLWLDWW
jgi:hypothetical protein